MLKTELKRFLGVGITSVILDFLFYHLMLWFHVDYAQSKAVSFIMGSIFGYLANQKWTFSHRVSAKYSVPKFAILYLSTLMINVAANALMLTIMGTNQIGLQLAFVIATAASAILNFIGMRLFVFIKPSL
jgi:polyisoprenyl-phosphate glycosyltransferase